MQDADKSKLILRLLEVGQTSSTETALFHQKVADELGMGITDTKAVSVLLQEGAMPLNSLASRLNLTNGAITNLVDRLENKGMVRRSSHPDDRRKTLVSVVSEAFESRNSPYDSMGEAYAKLLDNYSTEQLLFLIEYLESQLNITRLEIAKLSPNDNKERNG